MMPQDTIPTLPRKYHVYRTNRGLQVCGDSRAVLRELEANSVDLIITSPPFALQRKKSYGNKEQREYVDWLCEFGAAALPVLKDTGSFVMDLGGSYEKGKPVRSLYNFRVLTEFCDRLGYRFAEDFYWFNPAKLPSPIEWVNIRKMRAKDSVNTVWWFSKGDWPKADVTKVLTPYSDRMKKLLDDPESFFQPAKRPSGHDITWKFGEKENAGAIPSNLLQIPNTDSNSFYMRTLKVLNENRHPARFPAELPAFFIRLLTDPDDVVVDIFSGSNTTGIVAEQLGRRWISIELEKNYAILSAVRFMEGEEIDTVRAAISSMQQGTIERFTPFFSNDIENGAARPTRQKHNRSKSHSDQKELF
jgi:site-specific DNA-methyltransferase (cytosine-N4-specific)